MDFKKEILRKSLHLPGLFFLFFSRENYLLSIFLLTFLIGIYFMAVLLEREGRAGLPMISFLIKRLKRDRGLDLGPPFLALGLIVTLLFFNFPAAACGFLQVCVSDGAAAVAGKYWGGAKIFYSPEKTYVGTIVFFLTAFAIQLFFLPFWPALLIALFGSLLESLPFGAFDNFLIPLGSALFYHYLN